MSSQIQNRYGWRRTHIRSGTNAVTVQDKRLMAVDHFSPESRSHGTIMRVQSICGFFVCGSRCFGFYSNWCSCGGSILPDEHLRFDPSSLNFQIAVILHQNTGRDAHNIFRLILRLVRLVFQILSMFAESFANEKEIC